MIKYKLVQICNDDNTWSIEWDDVVVLRNTTEHIASIFIDGLERGITGSKQSLGSNSRREFRGWMDYLEAFADYDDYMRN